MSHRPYENMELLAELWDYLPVDVLDAIFTAGHAALEEALSEIDHDLRSLPSIDDDHALETSLANYEKRLKETFDHVFNKFQAIVICNVLKIPNHLDITLPHYKDLPLDCTPDAEKELDKELERARKGVIAQKAFKHMLTMELAHLDKQMKSLDEYKETLEILSKNPREQNVYPVNDTMRLLATQIYQLRESVLTMISDVKERGVLERLDRPDARALYLNKAVQDQLDAYKAGLQRR